MRHFWHFFLFVLATTAMTAQSLAQADAQQAFQSARAAYQAGNFAEARDAALKASQTDPKNAEVFLLLGQAHYQLGELDEAIAAWKRTLELAPEEPFAAKMLAVLGAERAAVDARIKLVEVLADRRLFDAAARECDKLLAEKALSPLQRAKIMTLQAGLVLRKGDPAPQAQEILEQVLALYPAEADRIETALLSGQIKVRLGGDATAEGIAILKKLLSDHPGTPAAATAQYELLALDRQDGADAAWADALAQWIADHAGHPLVYDARRELMAGYLEMTRRSGKPARDADLSRTDAKALALATELLGAGLRVDDANGLVGQLLDHVQKHYSGQGAHAAAAKAADVLLQASLPRTVRLPVLKAGALYRTRRAMEWLADQARTGQLPATAELGSLPEPLANVVAAHNAIRTEYGDEPLWLEQVQFAAQVRAFAAQVPWPVEVTGLRSPDAWALDIVWPALQGRTDPRDAVNQAVDVVLAAINDYGALDATATRELVLGVSRRLVEAVVADQAAWSKATARHFELLDAYARHLFQENIRTGNGEANAQLSDAQKEFLATLQERVAREAALAGPTLAKLREHLQPWIEQGYWSVVEEAYATLEKGLPEQQRREAALAVVGLRLQRVAGEHERLAAVGLTVPRQLDPIHVEALKRCYALQGEVGEKPEELKRIRDLVDQVVAHYVRLDYFDVAEQAVQVKAEAAVGPADEYAQLALVRLKGEQARRGLALFLKQYGAAEKITVTPEFQTVIAGYKKFITDRPASPMVAAATEAIFNIGQFYQSHEAHELAAGIYRDLAEFAAGVSVLSAAAPGAASTAERAAFAAAAATDAHARKLLARQMADRAPGAPPPEKLSEPFAAAVAAYVAFVTDRPDSPLAAEAIGRVMAVALEYAKVDAWDVADGVYASLAEAKLAIRRPERLEFCRALCQLGHAMPDHAREMLTTLTQGGLRETREAGAVLLANLGVGQAGAMPGGAMMPGLAEGAGGFGGMGGGMPGGPGMPGGMIQPPQTEAAASRPAPSEQPAAPPPAQPGPEADRDAQLLAMIHNQEASRAARVAQLRENVFRYSTDAFARQDEQLSQVAQQADMQQAQQPAQQQAVLPPVLSPAELARLEKALTSAYDRFQAIRKNYADTPTAEQARGEILVMVGHWRTLGEWQRAAELAARFLSDNPTDPAKPQLRLETARDWLAWASKPIERKPTRQAMLAEVSARFERARAELDAIVRDFPDERSYVQQAQWDSASSFLAQARVVDAFSPTLARGQYVRAAKELQRVAAEHPEHPQVGSIPQTLWGISSQLEGRGYFDEAILVWNDLVIHHPLDDLAQQAALKIAQTYHQRLQRPLKAAEAYQELNFARGGNDQELIGAIFQIGSELKDQKRWVEALHVLDTFVESFPRHPQAGQALTMVGQIHQTNEAWEDAIAAYRRVIDEFDGGQWVKDAKWAIAECTINLSRWHEASEAYRAYVEAYRDDAEKVNEANRRIEVLKDLTRYQALVDEPGQRKAFDAQFQIAGIVASQLSNRVKAIIEYRKVVANWPESHLADDALYEVGSTYLALGDTEKAREALLEVAQKFPASPLADDAVFLVGKSYEDEADKLASVTRAQSLEEAKDIAQRFAYEQVRSGQRKQEAARDEKIAGLKRAGKAAQAEAEEAFQAANTMLFNEANVRLFAQQAGQQIEALTATQLADRQDKINAALRKAVEAYTKTSKVAGADKADEALLQMATIYDQRLKDSQAAMNTWLEIVRQFSGTSVAEDASWRIAQTYERQQKYAQAVEAYEAFLRNYRRSPNAGQAQFAVAENYEHLGEWVKAMDSYTNYLTNFPEGPLASKAKEQINWIKTYRL